MKEYPYKERLFAAIIDSLIQSTVSSLVALPVILIAVIPLLTQIRSVPEEMNMFDTPELYVPILWLIAILSVYLIFMTLVGFYLYVYRPAKNNGQTIGKGIMKVKVVRSDNQSLTMKTLLARYLVQIFLGQAIGVFVYVTIFVDEEHRAVYDLIVGTKVIKS